MKNKIECINNKTWKVVGECDDTHKGSSSKRIFYTVQFRDNMFVDVMCCYKGGNYDNDFQYIMENGDGSTLYNKNGDSLGNLSDYNINEFDVINFIKYSK